MNIGILLAAGTSSRFDNDKLKQLYILNEIPIVEYSIKVMLNTLEKIIIITNTKCYEEIKNISNKYKNISIIINDINCRLESLEKGLEYLNQNYNYNYYYNNIKNVIIHDAARPYITDIYIKDLLKACEKKIYAQYYLKLVNGLAKKNNLNYEIKDRDEYIEICNPICIDYIFFDIIFKNYLSKKNRIYT